MLSESQYLEQQQASAKSAIANAFSEMKADLLKTADPKLWVKTHPWIMMASAAIAGFATAATAVPSKEQQALKKLESIERALYGRRNGHADRERDGKDEPARKSAEGFVGRLLHEALGALKPVIASLISSQMGQAAGQPDPTQSSGEADHGGPPNYPYPPSAARG